MNGVTRNLALMTTACVLALGLSGCATTATSIDSGDELAAAAAGTSDAVAFGKFRLVRNGREANIGGGIFASAAKLHFYQTDTDREIVGKVGKDGEFAWVLEPGTYQLSNIDFHNRGEKVALRTDFTFSVAADTRASYVGTVTLETSLDNGYYGVNGTVDRYTVTDDCAAECDSRLSQLGLSTADMSISLMQQQSQVASTN